MEDLTNKKFGKLTALRPFGKSKSGRILWECVCECGTLKKVLAYSLKNGDTKSCGCEHYSRAPKDDLTGIKFGKLTVVSYAGNSKWRCVCECGRMSVVKTYNLKSGKTESCGCLRKEKARLRATKHGESRDNLYAVLREMHQRCENKNNKDYKFYGGKGVSVCEEWRLTNYEEFKDWAAKTGYVKGLTIDRIDPYGNYCPQNCRWISIQEQQKNKRGRSRT